MKLLNTFAGFYYVRIPEYNLVILFDGYSENKLRKWLGNKTVEVHRQITKRNYATITHAFK